MKTKEKKSSPQPTPPNSRKKLILGLSFIILASMGVVAIFYLLMHDLRGRADELATLKDQVAVIQEEKDIVESRNALLAAAEGKSLSLDQVIQEAQKTYDDKVKDAREGYLWIDRAAPSWVITLGALNGLLPGSKVGVYKGEEKIETLQVETPLDVISYVKPAVKLKNQFENDYFRVVIE